MTISVNWATKVITIQQVDLTLVSAGLYSLDVNAFRLALKNLEDDLDGMVFQDTHSHNTEVTISGVTLARVFQIINGYTVTFQDTGTPYTVRCVGANHNIGDVKNVNQVSLIIGNSAGLIATVSGSGVTAQDKTDIVTAVRTNLTPELTKINAQVDGLTPTQQAMLLEIYRLYGLDPAVPLVVSDTQRIAGAIVQNISSNTTQTTITRVP